VSKPVQLTEHFSLAEMIASSTATRLGIDNSPGLETITRLTATAVALERVRKLLGYQIHIDSGYRSPELNAAVKGAKTSAHLTGYAADFTCSQFGTPTEIVKVIAKSGIAFDQCIQEGTWVHISFDPRMRQEVLTAHFGAGGTTYTKGA
jgi:hypothetical protein